MKRLFVLILAVALLISVTACKDKEKDLTAVETEEKETISKETEKQEKEPLTVDMILEDILSYEGFEGVCTFTEMSVERSEWELAECDISEMFSLTRQHDGNHEMITVCTLLDEYDAEYVEEVRGGNSDYCVRFGTIVVYGDSSIIAELDYSDYDDPIPVDMGDESFYPDPFTFEWVVTYLQNNSYLMGVYYDDAIIETLTMPVEMTGEVLNVAQLSEYADGERIWAYVFEFENEINAIAVETDRAQFVSGIENGSCDRIGNTVVYGNSDVIPQFEKYI